SDELMWSYYELLTDFEERVIVRLKEEVRTGVLHPMDAKMQLAHTIIANFHDEAAARAARDEFQRVFRNREAPEGIDEIHLQAGDYSLLRILTEHGVAKSRSEAERLIKQGAVEWNKTIIRDVGFTIQVRQLSPPAHWILKVGKKRFLKFSAK